MIKKLAVAVLLICAVIVAHASAQTAPDAEKQAAIKEYIAVLDENFKVGDVLNAIDGQMNQLARAIFNSMMEKDKFLTAGERKEFEEMFFNAQNGVMKRYEEKLLNKLDFEAMVSELIYKIYDKHFTLAEIRELTAFYRTPTGQKFLKKTPEIMQETLQGTFDKLIPKMSELNRELEADLKREIEVKITEMVAKRKSNSRKTQ